jgi:hypothetical protein
MNYSLPKRSTIAKQQKSRLTAGFEILGAGTGFELAVLGVF